MEKNILLLKNHGGWQRSSVVGCVLSPQEALGSSPRRGLEDLRGYRKVWRPHTWSSEHPGWGRIGDTLGQCLTNTTLAR